jgi:hypothetical protein
MVSWQYIINDKHCEFLCSKPNYRCQRFFHLKYFTGLSSPSSGSWTGCNAVLNLDSWVPSVNQDSNFSTINCTTASGNSGTSSSCASGVSSTAGGCNGCMDCDQVLNYYLNPNNTLLTDLNSRYSVGCTFNIELNNVWNNYYSVKEKALGSTVGGVASTLGVLPRIKQVQTDLNVLIPQVNNLPSLFSNILNGMSSLSPLIDIKYGLLASLNCTVTG